MRSRMRLANLLFITILLSLPNAVSANAGTPMMWAGYLHLTLGNVVIGIIEGSIIAWLFKADSKKAIGLMVIANFVSAYTGIIGLAALQEFLPHTRLMLAPLYSAPQILWATGITLFIATILLEYPFCYGTLRYSKQSQPQVARRALYASIVAQVLSYGLLIPYYLAVSPITVYTKLDVDRTLAFARKSDAFIYFIAPDGDVYRINIDGTNRIKVQDSNIREEENRLFVRKSQTPGKFDLWVFKDSRQKETEECLIRNFATQAALSWYSLENDGKETWASFGTASDLRPEKNRDWKVGTGYWPYEGITAYNQTTDTRLRVALETPFMSWSARCATVLPGDIVVCQLENQIVIIDLNHRKIGLLTLGRGPVAVIAD